MELSANIGFDVGVPCSIANVRVSITIALIPYAKGVRKTLLHTVHQQYRATTLQSENVTAMSSPHAMFQDLKTEIGSDRQAAARSSERGNDNCVIHSALLVNAVASLFRRRVPVVISPAQIRRALSQRQRISLWARRGDIHVATSCFRPSLSVDMIGPLSHRVFREHVDDTKGERHPLPAPEIA